eukprot:CAMPEP_0117662012 /NCGR_PEP_ID=MMETSP0804-20121206/7835_1 /TAXON_ID=1074897 /ORGANISM="Tetraselmis astigmatica, Strain CCMP880" /LENGTH=823 /DNA_ID=CAMNT_0005468901 /DNA_START=836 /DNA_END=3307 /DNA_ORIENTATION=-
MADCMVESGVGDLVLHWTDMGDKFALSLSGTSTGWIAVGFPSTPGVMAGAKVIQGNVDGFRVVELGSVAPTDFTETTIEGLNMSSITVGMFGGTMGMQFIMAKSGIANPAELNLITSMNSADSNFDAYHSSRGGFTANLELQLEEAAVPVCTASSNANFDCMAETGVSDIALHWKEMGDNLTMALTGTTSGWLSVGFPSTPAQMIGSKVIQGNADIVRVVELTSYDPSTFTVATIDGLDTDSLAFSEADGTAMLSFTMAKCGIPDPAALNIVTSKSSEATLTWPHSAWGGATVSLGPSGGPQGNGCRSGCIPSPDANYDCMMQSGVGDIALHWMKMEDHFMMALTGTTSGWLALGFPEQGGMVGSKAIQANADITRVVNLTSYDASSFTETTIDGLDVTSLAVTQDGGVMMLEFKIMESGISDPSALSLIAAMNSNSNTLGDPHTAKGAFSVALPPPKGGGTPLPPREEATPVATDVPVNSGCTPSPLAKYDCMVGTPIANYNVHWKLAEDLQSFTMAVSATTAGWVAVGFPTSPGAMTGAEAIFGTSDAEVITYTLVTKSSSSFTEAAINGLESTKITTEGGTLLLEFAMAAGAMNPLDLNLIIAENENNVNVLAFHTAKAALNGLNLLSGAPPQAGKNPLFDMMVLHGALMVLGWATLLPIGVILAHTMRHTAPLWFNLHRGVQWSGLLVTIGGLIVALVKFNPIATSGKQGAHAIIGLMVMVVGMLQPLNALFRPHPGEPNRKYWNILHIGLGRLAVMLGIANCFIGAILFNDYNNGNYEFVIFVAVWVSVAVFGVAIFMRTVVAKKNDAVETVNDPEKK